MIAESILLLLLPFGAYCLVLANINRREDPIIVSGAWDAVGLFLGCSGMLLGIFPLLIHYRFERESVALTEPEYLYVWTAFATLHYSYYVVLITFVLVTIWLHMGRTSIYNCDPDQVPDLLAQSAARAGLDCRRSLWGLEFACGAVRFGGFPMMRHMSLDWLGVPADMRALLEKDLRQQRELLRTAENSAAGWLMAISGIIFGVIFLALVLYVLFLVFPPRRW